MAYNSTNQYLKLLNELQAYNIPKTIIDSLSGYLKSIYRSELENHFSAPMIWIGLYIALASLVCILALVADLLHGLSSRKLWFPCKYFKMNSFFLTVISVAMKLPVDLTGSMPGIVDQVAKLGSMAFMCTMMANLLPCLATMDNDDLLSNIAALCLLVITLVVNVCIQIQTGVVSIITYYKDPRITSLVSPDRHVKSLPENYTTILPYFYVSLLLVLLILHVCSSLAIVKSKKVIESEYQQGHYKALKEIQQSSPRELLNVEKLKDYVRNHWIMAQSGSSQFIFTTCFQTSSASGVICVFVTILHILTISWTVEAMLAKDYDSDYGWSMIVIVIVQLIGVVIGTIAPLCRCFATFISFEAMSLKKISDQFKVFEVERYWTHKLYDWSRSDSLEFPCYHLEVAIKPLKRLIFNFLIGFQKIVVVVCKIIALIPFFVMSGVLYCYRCFKWLLKTGEKTANLERNKELRRYVSRHKEEMLNDRTIEDLSKSMNKFIKKCEKRKPHHLIEFIEGNSSRGFYGIEMFDRFDHYILSGVHVQVEVEYQDYGRFPDCWSLSVVALTSIAISLPKIDKNEVMRLLKSVRKGLEYVNLVEKNFNASTEQVSLHMAAETLWEEVDVYQKWLGNKVPDPSFQLKTIKQIVEWFNDTAKNILDTMHKGDDNTARGEVDESICAYSMYRITKTILISHHAHFDDNDIEMKLTSDLLSMIADIIAGCLTYLPLVITMKCHTSVMEKRETNLKVAAQLLGETSQLITSLQDRDIPDMDPNNMPFINNWHTYLNDQRVHDEFLQERW